MQRDIKLLGVIRVLCYQVLVTYKINAKGHQITLCYQGFVLSGVCVIITFNIQNQCKGFHFILCNQGF